MRHLRALTCLALAALLWAPGAAHPAQEAPPQPKAAPETAPPSKASLQLKETVHDFGSIMAGEAVEHVFEVRNTGADELVIKRVKPG